MMRSRKLREIDEKYANEDWYKKANAEFDRMMLEGFIVAIAMPIIFYILFHKHLLP